MVKVVWVGAKDIYRVIGSSFDAWGSCSARGHLEEVCLSIGSWNGLMGTAGFCISSHVLAVERKVGIGIVPASHCSRLPMYCQIIIGVHIHVRM